MKTIREWFLTLPDDIAAKAIANTSELNLKQYVGDLETALYLGFGWVSSNEGHDYWHDIYVNLHL